MGVAQTSAHAELSLIEALRQGDEDAFGRLVDEYHASLRRVARLYVSNRAVADEVVQDTWVGGIQGLWAFEGRSSLRTWIFRILINHAKTRAVREGRTVPLAGAGADDVGEPEAAVSPERFHPADHPTEPGHWTSPPRDIRTSPEGRLLAREAGEQLQKAIDAFVSSACAKAMTGSCSRRVVLPSSICRTAHWRPGGSAGSSGRGVSGRQAPSTAGSPRASIPPMS